MRRISFLWLFTVAAFAGLLHPARAGDVLLDDATKVRKLYAAKCARCHKLYEPQKYSEAEWDKWMGKMAKKSKLNLEQTELLTRHLGPAALKQKRPPIISRKDCREKVFSPGVLGKL